MSLRGTAALGLIAALPLALASSGCGSSGAEVCGDELDSEIELAFTDISASSPALAPSRGNPGWGSSDKYSPGVALADLDNDGILDLVQPRNDAALAEFSTPHVYRGVGDGTFVDVTPADWDVRRRSPAVLVFDIDADDDLDIYIGVDGAPSVLYRNDGDFNFTDVSEASGLAAFSDRVFVAAAGDIDADGDVDLYTGAWNASAEEHGPGTAPNRIFTNDGAGVFTELAGQAQCYGYATLAATLVDLDRDGNLDIYVGNDFFDDCLYHNNGDGTFTDIAPQVGTDKGSISAMGVSVGDINGDGSVDLLVTDGVKEDESIGNAVYLNRGEMSFDSSAAELGLGVFEGEMGPDIMFGWGSGIYDFDADGDNDVHVVTHITIEEVFWQNNDCGFQLVRSLTFGLPDTDGRGSAYGDIDNDGDIDIVVARRGDGAQILEPSPLQVLRNDTATPHSTIAIDVRPHVLAPGAYVTVTTDDGKTQTRSLETGSSYASTSPTTAIFGLGTANRVTRVEVQAIGRPAVVLEDPTESRITIDVSAP